MSEVVFSESAQREIEKILSRYPTKGAALLPVLHLAQEEFGVLTQVSLRSLVPSPSRSEV